MIFGFVSGFYVLWWDNVEGCYFWRFVVEVAAFCLL